jgi:hypothetical protein
MQSQQGWRVCIHCAGLYFAGHAFKGACPSATFGGAFDAEQHSTGGIQNTWLILFDDGVPKPNIQDGWRWCQNCEGIWFARSVIGGACPAGGAHTSSLSGKYRFVFGTGPDQFRWCKKCEGMFLRVMKFPDIDFQGPDNFLNGACPLGGPHDASESGFYLVQRGPKVPVPGF